MFSAFAELEVMIHSTNKALIFEGTIHVLFVSQVCLFRLLIPLHRPEQRSVLVIQSLHRYVRNIHGLVYGVLGCLPCPLTAWTSWHLVATLRSPVTSRILCRRPLGWVTIFIVILIIIILGVFLIVLIISHHVTD